MERFVNPTAGRGLAQLAEGLISVNPMLRQATEVSTDKMTKAEQLEGQARARELYEEGMTYKKAVEKGLISPDESPWFRMGAKEFFGRNAAHNYRDYLREKLRNSPVKDSTETADFDEFERETRAEFVEEFIGKDNRDNIFEASFGNALDGIVSNERNAFSAGAGARLVEKTEDAIHQDVMSQVVDAHTGDLSMDETAAGIQLTLDRAVAMGQMDKGALNASVAEAVINAARRANDPELLELLDKVKTSKGNTLLTARGVTDMVEKAEREIAGQVQLEEAAERRQVEQARTDRAREIKSTLVQEMVSQGPLNVRNFEGRVAELAEVDPAGAASMMSARTAMMHNMTINDPRAVNELVIGVYNGSTTLDTALQYMAAGRITETGLAVVQNHLGRLSNTGGRGQGGINDPAFDSEAFKDQERRVLRELGATDFSVLDSEEEAKAQRAVGHFRMQWYKYFHEQGGKDQTYDKQSPLASDLADVILDSYQAPKGGMLELEQTPQGVAGPNDPLYTQQPLLSPEVMRSLEATARLGSPRHLSREQVQLLDAMGVELLGGMENEAEDAQTILEAVNQQRFLYRLATMKR